MYLVQCFQYFGALSTGHRKCSLGMLQYQSCKENLNEEIYNKNIYQFTILHIVFYRLILPLMQSFTKAGDFTVGAKLKSALIDNAIYYGSYLLIAGILLLYLVLNGLELDG